MTEIFSMNRRGLMALAGVLAVPMLPAAKALASPVGGGDWNAAMARMVDAEARYAAFEPVWSERHDAFEKSRASVPHIILRPDPHTGLDRAISTADESYIAAARRSVRAVEEGRARYDNLPGLQQHLQLMRDAVSAADERAAKIRHLRHVHGVDDADEAIEDLAQEVYDATWTLMDMPAPDQSALAWKLKYLLSTQDGSVSPWSSAAVLQTAEDVERLLV